ncbi:FAD-binding oxidoreductase [Oceanobacillus bengalensis]|uniref:FAD-binding oxidoreductase n=1 Tax=Oceanobacillus bengalensis TaxID=1435466 RepID=A0A494YZR3_9BACI|nr:FAD-binding oxidoreductase [Oceanobacillus bengalensis]RKQ15709.1 FAD-binding oxidoreductase [Oceanobacillus bengalensis]
MQLQNIIQEKERLFFGSEVPEVYETDLFVKGVAKVHAVVLPETTEEVVALVHYANEKELSIIARGGGTGVAGAQVPITGNELIIDVHLMNHILELDEETMTLSLEPGVQLQEIQEFVESKGYFYPPDPGSKHSTIGGNVATNAGGMRAVKYGTTRDYIRELEIVLPTGEVVNLGSLNIKNSSGYDLKDLFIGSEGTLGITTKIKLKILPLPKYKQSVLLAFDTLAEATDGVLTILKSGIGPTALEMFEKSTIEYSEKFSGYKLQSQKGHAYVLMTIDSNDEGAISNKVETLNSILETKVLEIVPLTTPEEEDKVWKLRDNILVALMEFTEYEMLDEVVPINRFAEMIEYTKELQEIHGLSVINFGHAGDGNIHTVLMKENLDEETWQAKREALLDDLYQKVAELGGRPSAEHGIGIIKKSYFEKMSDNIEIELMKKIKNAIDPNNRLNPGKLF